MHTPRLAEARAADAARRNARRTVIALVALSIAAVVFAVLR